ncbi:hypothetical protein ACFWA6_13980 [Streptomyces sp. NPDC060020]|uniref:hypothetical protein n=1 Tax=Streptomyces sp. NPDC060020 TaxID=3347038 RepID=UPI0036CF3582
MPERTHLSQPDEALPRARGNEPTGTIRELLIEIADYLTAARPMDQFRDPSRLYLAAARAQRRYGLDSERVAETTRALLSHAPYPYAGETRGEYALRLRAAAGRGA